RRALARRRRRGGQPRTWQAGRRGDLEPQSVQRLCARRARVRGRRRALRPCRTTRAIRVRLPARPAGRRCPVMRPAHVMSRALLCAFAALPLAASADDLLIRNAKVHTVTERGTLERADVLVRSGRIAAVGTNLAAAGATVIDANGRPLTPGLFGGITALGVVEVSQEKSTVDNDPHAAERGQAAEPRPEFDVT